MSHSLYELAPANEAGLVVYRRLREIKLPSTIAAFVREVRGPEPGGWLMAEHEILSRIGGEPASHAVIVDLKPKTGALPTSST